MYIYASVHVCGTPAEGYFRPFGSCAEISLEGAMLHRASGTAIVFATASFLLHTGWPTGAGDVHDGAGLALGGGGSSPYPPHAPACKIAPITQLSPLVCSVMVLHL